MHAALFAVWEKFLSAPADNHRLYPTTRNKLVAALGRLEHALELDFPLPIAKENRPIPIGPDSLCFAGGDFPNSPRSLEFIVIYRTHEISRSHRENFS